MDEASSSSNSQQVRQHMQLELNHILEDLKDIREVVRNVVELFKIHDSKHADVAFQVLLRVVSQHQSLRHRITCWKVIDCVFLRWKAFREVVVQSMLELMQQILNENVASELRDCVLRSFVRWNSRFGFKYPMLAQACHHCRVVLKLNLPKDAEHDTRNEIVNQLTEMNTRWPERMPIIDESLQRISSCFEILLPKTGFHDEENVKDDLSVIDFGGRDLAQIPETVNELSDEPSSDSDEWESDDDAGAGPAFPGYSEDVDIVQQLGLASRSYTLQISFSTNMSDLETGNEALFDIVRHVHKKLIQQWKPWLDSYKLQWQKALGLSRRYRHYRHLFEPLLPNETGAQMHALSRRVDAALQQCHHLGIGHVAPPEESSATPEPASASSQSRSSQSGSRNQPQPQQQQQQSKKRHTAKSRILKRISKKPKR